MGHQVKLNYLAVAPTLPHPAWRRTVCGPRGVGSEGSVLAFRPASLKETLFEEEPQ